MDHLNFDQQKMADLALLGFYIIALLYIVYTLILTFHWKEYSVDAKVTSITLVTYFVFTLPLLLLLAITTFTI